MLIARKYTVPDQCPEGCKFKVEAFYQGCMCSRCPVFNCRPPKTQEDEMYMPILAPEHYRPDWAAEWQKFFETGEDPVLYLEKQF